jgi:hypothetical protein
LVAVAVPFLALEAIDEVIDEAVAIGLTKVQGQFVTVMVVADEMV